MKVTTPPIVLFVCLTIPAAARSPQAAPSAASLTARLLRNSTTDARGRARARQRRRRWRHVRRCVHADGVLLDDSGTVRQGREQLAALGRGERGAKDFTTFNHFVTNVLIEPNGAGAVGKAYVVRAEPWKGGGPQAQRLISGGHYRDELLKTASGWRIRKRTFQRAGAPAPASPPAAASPASVPPSAPAAPAAGSAMRLTAADYAEIYQLYGRYSYAFDGGTDSGRTLDHPLTADGFHVNGYGQQWVKGSLALADFARARTFSTSTAS